MGQQRFSLCDPGIRLQSYPEACRPPLRLQPGLPGFFVGIHRWRARNRAPCSPNEVRWLVWLRISNQLQAERSPPCRQGRQQPGEGHRVRNRYGASVPASTKPADGCPMQVRKESADHCLGQSARCGRHRLLGAAGRHRLGIKVEHNRLPFEVGKTGELPVAGDERKGRCLVALLQFFSRRILLHG
jgi:hypothetical protein